ncbi:MAG TPA: hypothetical protein VLC09_03875 [Polyangiaceae bacterium]|nr:hypothetical protein [Polyangiaceae bacterium]
MAADQSAEFSLKLNTEGSTSEAAQMASALQQLRDTMASDTKELRAMESAMRNLQKGSSVNVEQFRALKGQIDAKKKSIADAQGAYLKLGGGFDAAGKGAKRLGPGFSYLQEIAKRMPGPLGAILGKLNELQQADGGLAKRVLLKAAFVALTVAILASVAALAKYGVASSDARRSEAIQLEGLTKIRDWYGRTADKASFLQEQIDRVSASSALGRGKIAEYTEQLYKMGLRSGNLQLALQGMATVGATQGEAMAQRFASMAAGASFAGTSVKRLADDVQARLGGLAARKMLALDVQMQKLRENFDFLTSGLNLDKVLAGLNEVTSLFSASTASGRALRVIFTTLFQPLTDGAAGAGLMVKRFFQGMIIGALTLVLGFLKLRKLFNETFGGLKTYLPDIDNTRIAVGLGAVAVTALAVALTALAIKIAVVAAPFLAVAAAIAAALYVGYKFGEWVIGFVELLAGGKWGELGMHIVDGLTLGLLNGTGKFATAMKDMAKKGWESFKGAFGIASPSKLMRGGGLNLSGSAAIGVQDGVPKFKSALSDLADLVPDTLGGGGSEPSSSSGPAPITMAAPLPERSKGASVRGGNTVSGNTIHVHLHTDKPTAREQLEDLGGQFVNWLQNTVDGMGAEPEPA